MSRCAHEKNVVRAVAGSTSPAVCLDVCLDCKKVRSAAGGSWRDRVKADGVDSRWIVEMRKSLGFSSGPVSPAPIRRRRAS